MSDLIDRQAAIDAVLADVIERDRPPVEVKYWNMGLERASIILGNLPSAQRTGRWIWDDEGYHCSECFYHAYGNTSEVMLGDFKFCPNCGARMEVEE